MIGNLKADNIDAEDWLNTFIRNKVTIATDNLVAKEKWYFAAVLYRTNKKIKLQGSCDTADQFSTSNRIKLAGILAALYLLETLRKFTKSSLPSNMVLFCDNVSAVHATNTDMSPGIKTQQHPDQDIIRKIHHSKKKGLK
eukprot:12307187-Ditylum_brightwellii.AAC.1